MTNNHASPPRYVVREPRDMGELEALLRVRYSVFRAHEMRFLVQENEHGLDVDAWDKQAWHIGLYKQTATECLPIGYMRFIHNGPECFPLVCELGEKYPGLGEVIAQQPPAAHPFLVRYGPLLSPELLGASHKAPGKLAEVSRFALLDSEKSPVVSRFMVESVTAICHLCKRVDTVFQVGAHHAPFYQRYGYRPIAKCAYEELPWETVLIHAHPSYMGREHQPRIRHMAEAFEQHQGIWLRPSEPGNFSPPGFQQAPVNEVFELAET